MTDEIAVLSGKVAVISGASSGIGAAIARKLSEQGVSLVVTARRRDRLEALCNSLPNPSVNLAADIEDPQTPEHLLALAQEHFGRADIVVNNAGTLVSGGIDDVNVDDLMRMSRVNYEAVVRMSYVFGRHFKARESGAIINISSIGAYLSHSSMAVYGGLKQALETFTTALRVELKGSGVRVSSIAPGTTETEIFDGLRAEGKPVAADLSVALAPADVAEAVYFALTRPSRANVARLLLVSSAESA